MYKNLVHSFLLASLTILSPYNLTASASASASHADPELKPLTWWQSFEKAATRASATITGSPLASLMWHKTPERAHDFLNTIRIEEKVGDDKVTRTKADRYLNNATAELAENAIHSLTATIKELSIKRDFLTKLISLQRTNPLSQINSEKLSTINKSLVELESMVAQLKNSTPRTHSPIRNIIETTDSQRILYLTEEQLRDYIEPIKPHAKWSPEETERFNQKLNAYHASFITIHDLRNILSNETAMQREALFEKIKRLPEAERATAQEIAVLQRLKNHNYSDFPGLNAIYQKIKALQKLQLAVRLEPWILIEDEPTPEPSVIPTDHE